MSTIGIDLGTTNSAVASVRGGRTKILGFGAKHTMRSAVSFQPGDDEVIVGDTAAELQEMHPDLTVTSIKRHMGDANYSETIDGDYRKTEYTPEDISAIILRKLAAHAEDSTGETPEGTVITVPADFPPAAREATKEAAECLDIDLLRLLPEPSAACVAHGITESENDIEQIAVYDLGGGTFDISIVTVISEDEFYEVQVTEGRQELGGDDFDKAITEWAIDEFEAETGIDVSDDRQKRWQIRKQAKSAKENLSQLDQGRLGINNFAEGENLNLELTRDKFRELTGHFVDKTLDVCQEALDEESMSTDDIDTVLLVGGSTRMQQVEEAVEDFFGQEPSQEVNPDEAVAKGAARYANSLADEKAVPADTGGDEEPDDLTTGITVVNVVPSSVGIKLADGSFERLIEANDELPVLRTLRHEYTTPRDNMTRARVQVFQGENDTAEENEFIEEFILENIREAPAYEPDISLQVLLDDDATLSARAWDESVVDVDEAKLDEDLIDPADLEGAAGVDTDEGVVNVTERRGGDSGGGGAGTAEADIGVDCDALPTVR